jgi:hypothetical protein
MQSSRQLRAATIGVIRDVADAIASRDVASDTKPIATAERGD